MRESHIPPIMSLIALIALLGLIHPMITQGLQAEGIQDAHVSDGLDAWTHNEINSCASDHPQKLAIYFGYPSYVTTTQGVQRSDTDNAIQVFGEYDMVVFGEYMQDATNTDPNGLNTYNPTVTIIAGLTNTDVFGYIPLGQGITNGITNRGLTQNQIQTRIANWQNMGVEGIFLDEADPGFNVTTQFMDEAIEAVHDAGLIAFVNGGDIDHVFHENSPIASTDWYLLESFQITNGVTVDLGVEWTRNKYIDAAITYKNSFGTNMATTTTASIFNQTQMDYAWWSTLALGLEAMSWGEHNYAADDTGPLAYFMPMRARPNAPKLTVSGTPDVAETGIVRQTSRGEITALANTNEAGLPRRIRLSSSSTEYLTTDNAGNASLTTTGSELELVAGLTDPCRVSIRERGTSNYLIPFISNGQNSVKFEDQNDPVTAGSSFNTLATWYIQPSRNIDGTLNIYFDDYGYPFYLVRASDGNLYLKQWHNGSPQAEGSWDLL